MTDPFSYNANANGAMASKAAVLSDLKILIVELINRLSSD